jgi:hypothetical protein
VSTPVKDVADLYGDVVEIAASQAESIAAGEQALQKPLHERKERA